MDRQTDKHTVHRRIIHSYIHTYIHPYVKTYKYRIYLLYMGSAHEILVANIRLKMKAGKRKAVEKYDRPYGKTIRFNNDTKIDRSSMK